jgi:hypothetical protein
MSRRVRLIHEIGVAFLGVWSPSAPELWLLEYATLDARGWDGAPVPGPR